MLCFFFFQAEDGIRDRDVTGVQTCALPISFVRRRIPRRTNAPTTFARFRAGVCLRRKEDRSEERRVGKGVDRGGRGIIKKKKREGKGTEERNRMLDVKEC